ncbi:hypothetical protein BGZ63DRAFT_475229 [Mariannaea sp. PMI_226]|nr:hypothetical protein BGZ63DRAFT_475229 [Mariannaea sp. PMI_226]
MQAQPNKIGTSNPRRAHKKSRFGCQTCKRRKIKCDEVKPQCGNCCRFDVPCDFSPIPPQSIQSTQATTTLDKRSPRGRPRSNWASWAEQIRLSSTASDPGPCACSPKQLDIAGFELFHHFITNTAQTLEDDLKFWSEGVPQLGFQYPCILNLILALLRPYDAARYLKLADAYVTIALQTVTEFLKNLTYENSAPLYVTAVLICFTALVKGPTLGHLLLVAEHGQVPWVPLLGGVKLVITSMGWSAIFSGVLAKYKPEPEKERKEPPKLSIVDVEDWRSSLNDVSDVLAVLVEEQVRTAYEHEVQVLLSCFESTFGRGQDAQKGTTGQMQVVMAWVYQLNDVFLTQLDKKDPVALIILGHFCVLLSTIERYWFIEHWARHTMQEILGISESCGKWLSWPIQYLGRELTPNHMS